MHIFFVRGARDECVARVQRRDGMVLELPSASRRFRVPIDIAHFVTERELPLANGVFGSLAAGAIFAKMRVVTGSLRHDASTRSKRILAANRLALSVSDVLSAVLHDTVEHDRPEDPFDQIREGWATIELRPFPWRPDDVARAIATLRAFDLRWQGLRPDQQIEEYWPDVLTSPVPPPR